MADAAWTDVYDASGNLVGVAKSADVVPLPDAPRGTVCKAVEEQRYLLGVAYQPGADQRIAKGVDGGRDYFTEEELEKAAWSFMRSGPQVGAFHVDGSVGCAQPVESFIWRWDDWDAGDGIVVTKGTWLIGSVLDERSWDWYKSGRIGGYSPQGTARRRRRVSTGTPA